MSACYKKAPCQKLFRLGLPVLVPDPSTIKWCSWRCRNLLASNLSFRAWLHWNVRCDQMSFEMSFMLPIGTLSFLFYVSQWEAWNLFQMTFDDDTRFNVTEPLRKNVWNNILNCEIKILFSCIWRWFSYYAMVLVCVR